MVLMQRSQMVEIGAVKLKHRHAKCEANAGR